MSIDRHCGKGWATNKIGILFTEDRGDKITPGARLSEYKVAPLQKEPSDPELLDVVVLTWDRPTDGLTAGAIGTVVDIFDCPRRAYEVEFVADDGATVAIVTLLPEEIRPA
jgi:hypothetical protein